MDEILGVPIKTVAEILFLVVVALAIIFFAQRFGADINDIAAIPGNFLDWFK